LGGEVPHAISFPEKDVFAYCPWNVEIDLCVILTVLFQQYLPSINT
jgi:hypothetical protein